MNTDNEENTSCISLFIFLFSAKACLAQSISNIRIIPDLDISRFDDYTVTAEIADYPTTSPVNVHLQAINGDGIDNWVFNAAGVALIRDLTYEMTHVSGTIWQKTTIRPDYIYPQIHFAPSTITWNNTPSNLSLRRNNYSIFHISHGFTTTANMNFWIEINAEAVSANSADLQVYIVKKGTNLSFFNSDWRPTVDDPDIALVGTINRLAVRDHTHNSNSGHHLVTLTANDDGTFGANHLDISGDFWVVLYNNSPNVARGWNLRYHNASLCSYPDRWYVGNQTGWTTTVQTGCPDVHFHLARRDAETMDGVNVSVSADTASASQSFYFGTLPNLAPVAGRFTNPLGGAHFGNLDITWSPGSDPNGDSLTYKIYLLNSVGETIRTLSSGTTATTLQLDTTGISNGEYGLKGEVCDQEPLCVPFNSSINFFINNAQPEFYSVSAARLVSDNPTPTIAQEGDRVSLIFTLTGSVATPDVVFYSAGYPVTHPVTVVNTADNTWTASFEVDTNDTDGEVSFVIRSSQLDAEYYQTTDSSYVTISDPEPTPTPTPTSTSSPDPTPTPAATPTPTPTTSESSSSTSISSFSAASPQSCSDPKPANAPDLFQIKTSPGQAILYYAPVSDTNTSYYLAYGHESEKPIYGAVINQGLSSGVLSFTVNYLKPNTVYYFRIRGQNGCSPGDWSEEIRIKTPSKNASAIFHKYSKIQTLTSKTLKNVKKTFVTATPTPIITPLPSTPTNSAPKTPIVQPSTPPKKCFLFWCR